jgi:hypothetical protein
MERSLRGELAEQAAAHEGLRAEHREAVIEHAAATDEAFR